MVLLCVPLPLVSGGNAESSSAFVLLLSGDSGSFDASDGQVGGSDGSVLLPLDLDGILSPSSGERTVGGASSDGTIDGAAVEMTGGWLSASRDAGGSLLVSVGVASSASDTAIGGGASVI
jgi:hypothetical protein